MMEDKATKWRGFHCPVILIVFKRIIAISNYLFQVANPQVQLSYHLYLDIGRAQLPQTKSYLLSKSSSALKTCEEGYFFEL